MKRIKIDVDSNTFSPYLRDSIIKLLIHDFDFLKRCYNSVDLPTLFEKEPERKTITEMCYKYFKDFETTKIPPKDYIIDMVEVYAKKNSSKAELLNKYLLGIDNITVNKLFVLDRFGNYVANEIRSVAIEKAGKFLLNDKVDKIESFILEQFKKARSLTAHASNDIIEGIIDGSLDNHEFEHIDEGMDRSNIKIKDLNFRTFLKPYDKSVGGLFRKELVILFGYTNIGKSWNALYFGKIALIQGLKVLHITLETSKEETYNRYKLSLSARSNIVDNRLKKLMKFVKLRGAKLWLEENIYTMKQLYAHMDYLTVVHGTPPDVVIIDSPDQMIDLNNKHDQRFVEKELYTEFLKFANQYNITFIGTTQAHRRTEGKRILKLSDVAEGFDKIRVAHTAFSLGQTKEDKEAGIIFLNHLKSRSNWLVGAMQARQDLKRGQPLLDVQTYTQINGGDNAK